MGNGIVVVSFMLGFFSGRTIELLEKLKNIILPLGKAEGEGSSQTVRNFLLNGKVIAKKANGDIYSGLEYSKLTLEYKAEKDGILKSIELGADGAFEIRDLVPGWYTLTGTYSNSKAVYHLEKPFEIKDEDILNEVFELQESYSVPEK